MQSSIQVSTNTAVRSLYPSISQGRYSDSNSWTSTGSDQLLLLRFEASGVFVGPAGYPRSSHLFAEAVRTCGPDACPGSGTTRRWSTNVGLGEKEATGRGIRESAAYWEASRVGAKPGKAE